MPRPISRALTAAVSLAVGSWIGLGSPDAVSARALTHRLKEKLEPAESVHATTAPPVEPLSPQVDPSLFPDPTPWPRINPNVSINKAWLMAEGPSHAKADGKRLVTLTFDDGPFPETTPVVLKILAHHHARATFFFIGRYLIGDDGRAVATREVAKQVAAEGHYIGNHSLDHLFLPRLTHAQILEQIDDGAAAIEAATGKRPIFFRPPYGQVDPWTQDRLRDRGAELVFWSVEVGDMKRNDSVAMAESMENQIEYNGGGIVLLHDIRWSTGPALEMLLTWLYRHRYDPARPEHVGYELVDMVDYIRATAASPQPFADRREFEHARNILYRRNHGEHIPAALERPIGDGDGEVAF